MVTLISWCHQGAENLPCSNSRLELIVGQGDAETGFDARR